MTTRNWLLFYNNYLVHLVRFYTLCDPISTAPVLLNQNIGRLLKVGDIETRGKFMHISVCLSVCECAFVSMVGSLWTSRKDTVTLTHIVCEFIIYFFLCFFFCWSQNILSGQCLTTPRILPCIPIHSNRLNFKSCVSTSSTHSTFNNSCRLDALNNSMYAHHVGLCMDRTFIVHMYGYFRHINFFSQPNNSILLFQSAKREKKQSSFDMVQQNGIGNIWYRITVSMDPCEFHSIAMDEIIVQLDLQSTCATSKWISL